MNCVECGQPATDPKVRGDGKTICGDCREDCPNCGSKDVDVVETYNGKKRCPVCIGEGDI